MRLRNVLITCAAFVGLAGFYSIRIPMLANVAKRNAAGVWSVPVTGQTIKLPSGFKVVERPPGPDGQIGVFQNESADRDIRLKHFSTRNLIPLETYTTELVKEWAGSKGMRPGSPVFGKYGTVPFAEFESTVQVDGSTSRYHSFVFQSKEQKEIWIVGVFSKMSDRLSTADVEAVKKSFFPLSQ